MSKLLTTLFIIAGIGAAGCAAQTGTQSGTSTASAKPMATAPAPITKDAYDTAIKNAEAQFKADQSRCSSLSGNAKDICMAEATGKENVAKADAEAAYKQTPKAREDARVARAEASYKVAKEKCDDLSGNTKDVCVKEADAMLTKAKADAKVDRVTADTSQDAANKQADVRKEASNEKRDADYRVALEKCDAFSGSAKDDCVKDAKAKYGKS